MATCPECDAEIEVDEFDVDKGDQLSCPECGSNLEVTGVSPIELDLAPDDDDGRQFVQSASGHDTVFALSDNATALAWAISLRTAEPHTRNSRTTTCRTLQPLPTPPCSMATARTIAATKDPGAKPRASSAC